MPSGISNRSLVEVGENVRPEVDLLQVHPNPASDKFLVTYLLPSFEAEVKIHMYDIKGVQIDSFESLKTGILEVDATQYPNGLYIVSVSIEGVVIDSVKVQIVGE